MDERRRPYRKRLERIRRVLPLAALVCLTLGGLVGAVAWRASGAAGCAAGSGWAAGSRARFEAVLAHAAVLDPALGSTTEARAFAAELKRAVQAQRDEAAAPADARLDAALVAFYGRLGAYWSTVARGERPPSDAKLRTAGGQVAWLAEALASRCRGQASGEPSAPTPSPPPPARGPS